MKKVLFATTALVATAGVAAADVTFGGYGRFGIFYNSDGDVNPDGSTDSSLDVTSRFRLQVDATAESDAGVTLGARVRFQQNNTDNGGDPAGTGMNGARFFARSGGLEVGVGNIFGALEFMPGQYHIDLGLTGLGYDYTAYNFRGDAYSSGGSGAAGSNGVEVLYSMGDFSVHVSASDTNDRIAAVGAYTWSGWTVALGVQDSDFDYDTEYTASVSGNVGPASVSLAWARNGDDDVDPVTGAGLGGDHLVLAGTFDVGAATSIDAYVADADYFDETSYGIGFHHDLGGGVSLRGGVAHRRNDTTIADMGVRFNF